MPSKDESVIAAFKEQIEIYFAGAYWLGEEVTIMRNAALPEIISGGGLIIIRDGDPGDPDQAIGRMGPIYYRHTIEIELYVQKANQELRDSTYSELMKALGLAIENDTTLGGEIKGLEYGRPKPMTEPVEGAEDIKAGVLFPVLDYEANTPLA